MTPLTIAERVNASTTQTPERQSAYRKMYTGPNAIRYVLGMPCMEYGPTRKRLDSWMACEYDRCNILWPHHKSGEWDAVDASAVVHAVKPALAGRKLVLLGRRVGVAFGLHPEWPWGESTDGMILLPHPSGRSRVFNDDDERDAVLSSLREFLVS